MANQTCTEIKKIAKILHHWLSENFISILHRSKWFKFLEIALSWLNTKIYQKPQPNAVNYFLISISELKDMFIRKRQLCISRKLKKNILWITSVYLKFRHWNFSHRRKPWLCKYLLHCHLKIFIQGRVMLKKSQCLLLSNLCQLPMRN